MEELYNRTLKLVERLFDEKFDKDRKEIIEETLKKDVSNFIVAGYNIDSSKLITNHAILALCNLAMVPKIVKDDNFLAIAGIVNLILSVINQRIFSDKEHEKELKTFYQSVINKLDDGIANANNENN